MKQLFFTIAVLLTITAFKNPSTHQAAKQKLYDAVDKFYKDLPVSSVAENKKATLYDFYSVLVTGISSDNAVNIVFTCPDNSFKSLAAQIITQSLVSVNKYNKLVVFSGGYQPAEVSPVLLKILAKHGYIVSEQTINAAGKKAYEIKFGDNMQPLSVYSKQVKDAGLPKSIFMQMKLCGANEKDCSDLEGARFKETINYADTNGSSEEQLDKEFTEIATDIVWSFNQIKL